MSSCCFGAAKSVNCRYKLDATVIDQVEGDDTWDNAELTDEGATQTCSSAVGFHAWCQNLSNAVTKWTKSAKK